MNLANQLARESIRRLRPYKSARSLIGRPGDQKMIFLDANESPEGELHGYPEPQPADLVQSFAQLYGVLPEQLLIGRGSDEAIDLLIRTFCEPKLDRILITPPTYGMYEVAAAIQDAGIFKVPLRERNQTWELPVDPISALNSDQSIKIVFICSPNNPTGTAFDPDAIFEICKAFATSALVVVDEAYAEFSPALSVVSAMASYPNLVVLRTLSKAWAMAGLRCGFVLAPSDVISILQKVRAPYPLPEPCIEIARRSVREKNEMQARVAKILHEKEFLQDALLKLPNVVRVFSSQANFLLAQFQDAGLVMRKTHQAGIVLRDRREEISECIRLTVGTREQNNKLIECLK